MHWDNRTCTYNKPAQQNAQSMRYVSLENSIAIACNGLRYGSIDWIIEMCHPYNTYLSVGCAKVLLCNAAAGVAGI